MAWVTGQASQNSRFIFVSLEKNWRTGDTPMRSNARVIWIQRNILERIVCAKIRCQCVWNLSSDDPPRFSNPGIIRSSIYLTRPSTLARIIIRSLSACLLIRAFEISSLYAVEEQFLFFFLSEVWRGLRLYPETAPREPSLLRGEKFNRAIARVISIRSFGCVAPVLRHISRDSSWHDALRVATSR